MKIYGQTFDEERALYGVHNAEIENCLFAGEKDGESALKEAGNIRVSGCRFLLRYPFWHVTNAEISNVEMTDTCRAALWYCRNVKLADSALGGIKALRECTEISLRGCRVVSPEFGWHCKDVTIEDCDVSGEYFLMNCENVEIDRVHLSGKYSFQYCKNVTVRDSVLDTKDAFWETENVTVYDSVVNGEYLSWYAKNLRLVNCKIRGTQPLCYANGLILENCTMENCDLSFEYSTVTADVAGHIDSVKNPSANSVIVADSFGEIILDENRRDGGNVKILTRNS